MTMHRAGANPGADSALDSDGDGHSAWQEFLAGTDPTQADSVLRFLDILSGGASNRIRWIAEHDWVGTPFIVERSTNLVSGWQLVDALVPRTPATNTWWDAHPPTNAPAFYRIRATDGR
jgi:hypothetical protein